jgi:CDP-diacylglycerol--serine O-phosphatidyltransferase
MKRHIPNFLTCCNLLCGTFGILYILSPNFGGGLDIPVAYFVWAACVFDFFDGFVARWLKVSSPIGKELDSLADVVSFGLLPAFFMYNYIGFGSWNDSDFSPDYPAFLPYVGFLIVVCSALRLAIFNVDETQKDSFRGVPTPANTLFITGLVFLSEYVPFISNPWVLSIITIVFSLLLVSRFELFALKFKSFKWADNQLRFTFLLLAVLLLVIFKFAALPLIIILYILLSLGARAFAK